MAIEIERRYLVINDSWKTEIQGIFSIKQGYLNLEPESNVRVRVKDDKGYLTIKGEPNNISRQEFEYEIPIEDAEKILTLCQSPIIEKVRYEILIEDHIWEIDEFSGKNQGLIIAEIELTSEEQAYKKPEWLGIEVSNNPDYYNLSLIQKPYSSWN